MKLSVTRYGAIVIALSLLATALVIGLVSALSALAHAVGFLLTVAVFIGFILVTFLTIDVIIHLAQRRRRSNK